MTTPVFLIGKAADCDLVLGDSQFPELHTYLFVQRQHVLLRFLGRGPEVQVHGRAVERFDLLDQDEFSLGDYDFRLHLPKPRTGQPRPPSPLQRPHFDTSRVTGQPQASSHASRTHASRMHASDAHATPPPTSKSPVVRPPILGSPATQPLGLETQPLGLETQTLEVSSSADSPVVNQATTEDRTSSPPMAQGTPSLKLYVGPETQASKRRISA